MPFQKLLLEANHGEFALESKKEKNKSFIQDKTYKKSTREKPGKTPGTPRETPGTPGNFETAIPALPILGVQAIHVCFSFLGSVRLVCAVLAFHGGMSTPTPGDVQDYFKEVIEELTAGNGKPPTAKQLAAVTALTVKEAGEALDYVVVKPPAKRQRKKAAEPAVPAVPAVPATPDEARVSAVDVGDATPHYPPVP